MAPADIGLARILRIGRGFADRQFALVQSRAELVIGFGLVLVLAALVLTLHDDAGRDVGDAHRRIGGVDVLPASARRAIGVDAQVAFVIVDLDIVIDHRIDPNAGKRGVAAGGAVIRADAHQAVDTAFGLGIAVGVLAFQQQRRRLDSGLLARMLVDQFDLQAVAFAPARIHAAEHPGPVLALGAARPGIDLDIGVVAIGFARQQRLDLVLFGAAREIGERGEAVGLHLGIALGLGHFDQLCRIVELAFDRARCGDRLIETAPLPHNRLRRLGVVPQSLILNARVEFIEPTQRAVPVEEPAEQRERVLDRVDMSLRFSAHGRTFQKNIVSFFPLAGKR